MTMLEVLPRVPDWVLRAECGPQDAKLFDGIVGTAPTPDELATRTFVAEVYCAVCPVRAECAAQADSFKELGVWGGSLRYVTGSEHPAPATYVAVPLLVKAVPSWHEVAGTGLRHTVDGVTDEAELLEKV
jgi:hypothetical protein